MLSKAAHGLLVTAIAVVLAAPALAHVERPSFWPDPAADTTVVPAAGGAVPVARSLGSALHDEPDDGTTTRIVCQDDSLRLARASIAAAEADGYVLRPSQPRVVLTDAEADRLLQINEQLHARCEFDSIQAAVNASGNNDRVVIMPGLYLEEASRATPSPDTRCDRYKHDVSAGGAVSYRFQFFCPNDQNLIAVNGRALGPYADAEGIGATPPPSEDRHGIPNAGACIRCNLQIEGSGPGPDDVIVEAGDPAAGDGGPSAAGQVKHIGIKVDRADGIVIRNLKVRHAREHNIYVMETDGYLVDRVKVFWPGDYGVLTFGTDHGVMQDCEGIGAGDSALYPGGSPDTGAQRDTSWYPVARFNQEIRRCDMHHNNLGYSGTMGNGVHVVDNEIYDNVTGIATDSLYAGGHPGYPQDSSTFENNRIYSNNLNNYLPGSEVKRTTDVPVGVGIIIAGGNDNVVRNNVFFDNWRRAVMLISVPTEMACPIEGNGCVPKPAATDQISNSYRNRFYGNVMGTAPGGAALPNGQDFWWDPFPTTTGNCFYANGATNSDPPQGPVAGQSIPGFLPENCATSVGWGDPVKDAELLACAGVTEFPACTWGETPPPPGTAAAARFRARGERLAVAAAGRSALRFDAHCVPDGIVRSGLSDLGCRGSGTLLTADGPQPFLQSVTCADWRHAGASERLTLIATMTSAATEPDPENPGATLAPGQAADVLDRACDRPASDALRLYGVYNRAAAFQH